MGERRAGRSRLNLRIVGAVSALVLIASAVYWFAIRDDNQDPKSSAQPISQGDPQKFTAAGVPFTFEYPANFAEAPVPEGFIWIAGISPSDILDVRRVDTRSYSARGLATVIGSRLELQTGAQDLKAETVRTDGFEVVRYRIKTGTDPELQSTLLFFSTENETWQIECQAQPTNVGVIEAACAQALSSLTPTQD